VPKALGRRIDDALIWLRVLAGAPLLPVYRLTGERATIDADAARWMQIAAGEAWPWRPERRSQTLQLLYLLATTRSFRSLFWYRIDHGGPAGRVAAALPRRLYRGELSLHLHADEIGPGLYIPHGFSTIVSWKTVIGTNCRLHQNVTIGWDGTGGAPRIGNNVTIYTGAVVIGDITVGDDVVVGANAVVTKDVPAGMVARGVPATSHSPGRPTTP
jgi:serine O-acetyltransferase